MKCEELLLDENIINILIGDKSINKDIIYPVNMPYLRGIDICNIANDIGFKMPYNEGLYKGYSRKNYMKDLIKYCIKENKISNLFNEITRKNKFKFLAEDSFLYRGDSNMQYYEMMNDFYTSVSALTTNDGRIHNFLHYNGGAQAYTYLNYDVLATPILPSLFGTKYLFAREESNKSLYKELESFKANNYATVDKTYNVVVYENNNALNIGYTINKNFDKKYRKLRGTAFDNINDFFKAITGVDKDIMIPIKREKIDELEYKYYINRNDKYLYFSANYDETVNASFYTNIYINDNFLTSLDSFNIAMYKIENKYYDQDILLALDDDYKINCFNLYYFDEDVFKKGINKLKEHQLENIKLNKNKLTGEINLDEDSLLFLSIPYNEGWKVYIDGKKTAYRSIADTFMGVNVPKGKHKISMKFYPRGILLGTIISLLSIMGIIILQRKEVYSVKEIKRKNKK